MTQALGGLAGSAVLGAYQLHREQEYSAALTRQVNPAEPAVAARLQLQQQALAGQTTDPALRAAQGAAQLAQVVRREANVSAFNDVFRVVSLVAVAYLAWSLVLARRAQRAAARAALQNKPSVDGGADGEVGTDAAITDAPEPESQDEPPPAGPTDGTTDGATDGAATGTPADAPGRHPPGAAAAQPPPAPRPAP